MRKARSRLAVRDQWAEIHPKGWRVFNVWGAVHDESLLVYLTQVRGKPRRSGRGGCQLIHFQAHSVNDGLPHRLFLTHLSGKLFGRVGHNLHQLIVQGLGDLRVAQGAYV